MARISKRQSTTCSNAWPPATFQMSTGGKADELRRPRHRDRHRRRGHPGKSSCWDRGAGCLYWIDVRRPALHRFDQISGTIDTWPMPALIGAVVPRNAGGVVVALRDALYEFDPRTAVLSQIGETHWSAADMRLNDAKCDRLGRIWYGRMRDFGADGSGGLLQFAPGKAATEVLGGNRHPQRNLLFSRRRNGLRHRHQGRRHPERHRRHAERRLRKLERVRAGRHRPRPARRRDCRRRWLPVECPLRWRSHRPHHAGRTPRPARRAPRRQPTSCAFGGSDLSALFVTTARQKLSASALAAEPHAGALLALDVGAHGLAEPGFGNRD